ncbi:translocation/assembly module TamB domain-containing protein [Variovorax defluvii]|uniref:Translocation/assembly module TamB domain-containing protein n=1 Tax=Variovorax defluvii TaxID=913761 RepID=A0ABP8I1U8_9BURK
MQPDAPPSSSPPRRSRARRALHALAWSLLGLIVLVGVLVAGAWWWLGTSESLAFALARAARYLPAGQSLESREVRGSIRAGGRIGWLRWQSESLAVEVRDATIGWTLPPLLERKVKLGEVHAAQVLIEPRGPKEDKPLEPLSPIVLPVTVELPFRIDELQWAGPPALKAGNLAGSYRYEGDEHRLVVDGVDIAEGHYGARVTLQGPAPMALDAALEGRIRAPLAEDRAIDLLAQASARGTLATTDARLAVEAEVRPAEAGAADPMQARLRARLAPWLPQPVIDAEARLQNLDLALLWPEAPGTLLSGEIEAGPEPGAPGAPAGSTVWQARADIRNARPGPWDSGLLPVEQVQARASFDGSSWTLPEATVHAGGGRIDAQGRWSPAPAPWDVQATLRGVNPGALHTALAGPPVSGRAEARQREDTVAFDLALQAGRGAGPKALQGLRLDRALARGQYQLSTQVLDLRTLQVAAANATLDGKLQARIADQAGNGELKLSMPGGQVQLQGRATPATGGGEIRARVDDAAALQRWVEGLPALSAVFAGTRAQGSARLDASWQGGWQTLQRRLRNPGEPAARGQAEPTVEALLTVPRLAVRLPAPAEGGAPTDIQLRDLRADLAGSLAQATLALRGEAATGTQKLTLDARASGGVERARQWRASIASLRVQAHDSTRPGPWILEMERPLSATVRSGDAGRLEVEASAAGATLRGPVPGTVRLDWEPLRYSHSGADAARVFRLKSQGRLRGLPMAWAEALGSSATLNEMGISGDLQFDGDWDIDAGDTLRARARLTRAAGDIRVQAGETALVTRITSRGTGTASERTMNASGEGAGTPAGLRQAEFGLDAEGDTVRATVAWDSERAGQIRAEASTRVQQRAGGWQWATDAPLAGKVSARLPNLGVWSMLAPPGWRIAGTLEADATLSGNRALPRWNGTLVADKLALRALVEGLDLRDGRLRASLTGERIEITEFSLKGGTGSATRIPGQSGNLSTAASEAASDGGSLSARGELSWGPAPADGTGIRLAVQTQLRKLRVLVRADRQVTLSGDLQTRLDNGRFTVRGNLQTDRAVIILPDETAPSLGSDVVVRSAAKDREAAEADRRRAASDAADEASRGARAETAKPPDIAIGFDLGEDFAVQGRGITTRLEGKLDVRSNALDAPPRISGEVRTVKGQYRAYGQRLDVETGIARFNGPYDNPALDILAIRPNISQRAGVQITGTAQSPRVRLYSEPPLSDAETLSWVILGRASATSGGESLLLQQAALALLGKLGSGSPGGGLASRFGLDEIGFKGPGNGGDVRESAVTLGKRLSKDFYVTYERSLSGTLGTLFVFYDLTRRLTLRGQAGQQSGIDLIYTVKYD